MNYYYTSFWDNFLPIFSGFKYALIFIFWFSIECVLGFIATILLFLNRKKIILKKSVYIYFVLITIFINVFLAIASFSTDYLNVKPISFYKSISLFIYECIIYFWLYIPPIIILIIDILFTFIVQVLVKRRFK